VDFDRLEVRTGLSGDAVSQVRVNQPVRIRVRPSQPPHRTIRADLAPAGNGGIKADRVSLPGVIDDALANWLTEELRRIPLTARGKNDLALTVTGVEKIEADARLTTTAAGDGEGGTGETLEPFLLPERTLTGRVAEVTHTASLTLVDLPPGLRDRFRDRLRQQTQGKRLPRGDAAERVDDLDLRAMTIKVEATAEGRPVPGTEAGAWPAHQEERGATARIVLDNPPPALRQAVERRYRASGPGGPRVDVEVVTGRRAFVSRLFKSE
jgi:hypothetical protein